MFKVVWCLVSLPASVLSQAWLSPKGEGTTAVLYQYGIDRLHVFSDGRTKDRGHTYLSGVLVDTDFSLTDKACGEAIATLHQREVRGPQRTYAGARTARNGGDAGQRKLSWISARLPFRRALQPELNAH